MTNAPHLVSALTTLDHIVPIASPHPKKLKARQNHPALVANWSQIVDTALRGRSNTPHDVPDSHTTLPLAIDRSSVRSMSRSSHGSSMPPSSGKETTTNADTADDVRSGPTTFADEEDTAYLELSTMMPLIGDIRAALQYCQRAVSVDGAITDEVLDIDLQPSGSARRNTPAHTAAPAQSVPMVH